jgi:cytochrome c
MKTIMKSTMLKSVAIGLSALTFCASALADAGGTPQEAVALVKKAVAYVKANGKDKAFAEFNNPKGQFVDRSLYIFVYDLKGTSLAIGNGNGAKMVGKNLIDMRDAEGNYLIKGLINVANTKGSGWFDYKWPNPVSKAVETKSSYVEKLDDIMIGCGVYKIQ